MATRNRNTGLDRGSAQPLHAQIAAALREEIRGQALAPGSPLPSEAALCERFGVARSVVRQALSGLAGEGVVRREPGRPAVVAPVEHRRLVQRTTGLYEQFAGSGVALRTKVVRVGPAEPPPAVAAFFGAGRMLAIERLRCTDEGPLAYVHTWLPETVVGGLQAADLADVSLHGVLARRYGRRPLRGRNTIRAVAADARLAAALEVPRGSPLLLLEGRATDQDGHPLEWFHTWHRADRLVFDVDVSPEGEALQPALAGGPGGPDPDRRPGPRQTAPAASLQRLESLLDELQAEVRHLRREG